MAINTVNNIYRVDTFSDIAAAFPSGVPNENLFYCLDTLTTYLYTNNAFYLFSSPTASKVFANPTRTLNSAFQISATRDAEVSYSVNISAALSLAGGAVGTIILEYADDVGFTTNVKTVQSGVNGNSGTLTIGLGLTQLVTATVTGMVPAGKYVRISTANTSGSPAFTYLSGQEVLI